MAHTRRGERFSPWFSAATSSDEEWIVVPSERPKRNTNDETQAQPVSAESQRQGVIAVVQREDCFLVIRRSHYVRAPRKFCFPGGGVEHGETQIDAIHREMQEELNALVQPIRSIWQSQTSTGIDLYWWKVELLSEKLRPNPAEVEAAYWMTLDHILSEHKLLDTNREFLLSVRRGEIEL
jgi:8-oxo-dGTP pyrophosphatase MutT (NUDIX family)